MVLREKRSWIKVMQGLFQFVSHLETKANEYPGIDVINKCIENVVYSEEKM